MVEDVRGFGRYSGFDPERPRDADLGLRAVNARCRRVLAFHLIRIDLARGLMAMDYHCRNLRRDLP